MEKQAKGKTFLLVTGILLIILAAFAIFGVAGTAITLSMMNSGDAQTIAIMEQTLALTGTTAAMLKVSAVISAFSAVIYLVAGILGIKNRQKPQKAQSCFIMGIVMIALILLECVYSAIQGKVVIWSVGISLIIPLLYLWGAIKNKQSAEA